MHTGTYTPTHSISHLSSMPEHQHKHTLVWCNSTLRFSLTVKAGIHSRLIFVFFNFNLFSPLLPKLFTKTLWNSSRNLCQVVHTPTSPAWCATAGDTFDSTESHFQPENLHGCWQKMPSLCVCFWLAERWEDVRTEDRYCNHVLYRADVGLKLG